MLYRSPISTPAFSLRREIDRLFDDAFGREGARGARATWAPVVDVREEDRALIFEFELPGLRPEQVEITSDNGVLTVRGDKREERTENEGRQHIVERTYGAFSRSFQLPQGVDEERIEASFENGVLTVRVPKAAQPQPRRIQIRGAAHAKSDGTAQVRGGNARTQQSSEQPRDQGAGTGAGAR